MCGSMQANAAVDYIADLQVVNPKAKNAAAVKRVADLNGELCNVTKPLTQLNFDVNMTAQKLSAALKREGTGSVKGSSLKLSPTPVASGSGNRTRKRRHGGNNNWAATQQGKKTV